MLWLTPLRRLFGFVFSFPLQKFPSQNLFPFSVTIKVLKWSQKWTPFPLIPSILTFGTTLFANILLMVLSWSLGSLQTTWQRIYSQNPSCQHFIFITRKLWDLFLDLFFHSFFSSLFLSFFFPVLFFFKFYFFIDLTPVLMGVCWNVLHIPLVQDTIFTTLFIVITWQTQILYIPSFVLLNTSVVTFSSTLRYVISYALVPCVTNMYLGWFDSI